MARLSANARKYLREKSLSSASKCSICGKPADFRDNSTWYCAECWVKREEKIEEINNGKLD